ncbi:MAG: LamG-like jellyroll fold domain-containing protein [Kiritimatiellales bacterium]
MKLRLLLAGVIFCAGSHAAVLVSHYDFNNDSVGTVQDSAGSYNGTIVGDPVYSLDSPLGDYALNFNGDDWVELGSSANFSFASISVAFWAKPTVDGNIFLAIGQGSSNRGLMIQTYSGDMLAQMGDGTNDSYDPETGLRAAYTPNSWMHIAATFDDTTKQGILYLNGEVAKTFTAQNSIDYVDSNPARIGNHSDRNGAWLVGSMDDVRIYNGVLTSGEVSALAIPEPASIAMLGFVVSVGFFIRRRFFD